MKPEEIKQLIADCEEEFRVFERPSISNSKKLLDIARTVVSRDEIIKAKIKHWQRIKDYTLIEDTFAWAYADGMIDGLGIISRINLAKKTGNDGT